MNIYDAMHGWIKISDAAKCRIGLKKFALQSSFYCWWTAERVTGWFPGHSMLQICAMRVNLLRRFVRVKFLMKIQSWKSFLN